MSFARTILLVALAGLLLPRPVNAGVITVGPSGADFTSIQAAVDAAADGDTILVRPDPLGYTAFSVNGKALALVADGTVVARSCQIQNVALGATTSLSGFTLADPAGYPGVLQVISCAGSIRIESLNSIVGGLPTRASVTNSSDVAFVRATVFGLGGASTFQPGTPGLDVDHSTIALYDCTVGGGPGASGFLGAAGGGAGLQAANSFVFASHVAFTGGNGGNGGCSNCGVIPGCPTGGGGGGNGILVQDFGSPPSSIVLLDCTAQGGANGAPGCGFPSTGSGAPISVPAGRLTQLAGAHRELDCPALARENTTAQLMFRGQSGDRVILVSTAVTRFEYIAPFRGVSLYGLSSRRFAAGTIPASGMLTMPLSIPDLGPGVQDRKRYLQGVFIDTNGAVTLGSPAVLVLLDSAF